MTSVWGSPLPFARSAKRLLGRKFLIAGGAGIVVGKQTLGIDFICTW